MNARTLIEQVGGRRFLLCLLTGAATVALNAAGSIDGAVYATVMLGVVGAYVAGNTTQKIKAPGAGDAS